MAVTDVFPINPSFTVPQKIDYKVLVTETDSGQEKRMLKSSNPKRSFRLTSKVLSTADQVSLRDFYIARQGSYDTFSFLPPINFDRLITSVACGTGDGVETEFTIGNSASPPYYYRVYDPSNASDGRNVVYIDGVSQGSGWTIANNDSTYLSTVTFSSPPADTKPVTVDIDRYLICRFGNDPYQGQLVAYSVADASVEIVEVFKDSI